MPWQVLVGAGAAILLASTLACLLSITRVMRLEFALIVRGQ